MRTITVDGKEYILEYTFEAAKHKKLIQLVFNMMSGAYFINGENGVNSLVDGVSTMVSDIPEIACIGFYAGLLENNPMTEDESNALLKAYMKENKFSFNKVYEDIKGYMEEDGFFDLSGLTEMIERMNQSIENHLESQEQVKPMKKPTDHKKKTSSK